VDFSHFTLFMHHVRMQYHRPHLVDKNQQNLFCSEPNTFEDDRLRRRQVNLSFLCDSCWSSEHDHGLLGDRLLSANRHAVIAVRERDNGSSCRYSEPRLIGVNYLR
jgi:hypothetical protein